jgi:hypothetical protein
MLCASQQRNQGLGGERQGHDPGGHGPVIEEARGLADLVGWPWEQRWKPAEQQRNLLAKYNKYMYINIYIYYIIYIKKYIYMYILNI